MKSLSLHIQSSLDSLHDCLQELIQAQQIVDELDGKDADPPFSSTAIERVSIHCLKAQRELQTLSGKVRP